MGLLDKAKKTVKKVGKIAKTGTSPVTYIPVQANKGLRTVTNRLNNSRRK